VNQQRVGSKLRKILLEMEPIEENHVTEDHDNDHMTDYGEQSMSGEYIR